MKPAPPGRYRNLVLGRGVVGDALSKHLTSMHLLHRFADRGLQVALAAVSHQARVQLEMAAKSVAGDGTTPSSTAPCRIAVDAVISPPATLHRFQPCVRAGRHLRQIRCRRGRTRQRR